MSVQRLSVAMPFLDGDVDAAAFVPVFHGWIRDSSVEGLLIDVARYAHVHEGPGVMLIGYEGDYSVDLAGGRPSLKYTLKRDNDGTVAELVDRALSRLGGAADAAERDADVRVDRTEVTVTVVDRLNYADTADARERLLPEILAGAGHATDRVATPADGSGRPDPRSPISVRLTLKPVGSAAG